MTMKWQMFFFYLYTEFNAGIKLNNICTDVNFKVIFNTKTH